MYDILVASVSLQSTNSLLPKLEGMAAMHYQTHINYLGFAGGFPGIQLTKEISNVLVPDTPVTPALLCTTVVHNHRTH